MADPFSSSVRTKGHNMRFLCFGTQTDEQLNIYVTTTEDIYYLHSSEVFPVLSSSSCLFLCVVDYSLRINLV